jgi:broad specificity phosphatase PhoE
VAGVVRLILVRHGQSEGNASGVIQGRLDFGLSPLGEAQARATAERLAKERVDRMITSPLARAADTARLIAEPHGLVVEPEPALLEYDVGIVSGLTGAQIRERYPEVLTAHARGERPKYPGEEGREGFIVRVTAFLETLRHSNETTIAVAHGGVISAACSLVLGIDAFRPGVFHSWNCSITELTTDRAGRFVIQRQNDTCHLEGLLTTADRG